MTHTHTTPWPKPKPKPKHFDVKRLVKKLPKRATEKKEPVRDVIEVPVTMGFDWNSMPIGHLVLTPEAASMLIVGMVLAPAYETEPEHKLTGMGMIVAGNAAPPKARNEATKDPRYQGFLWHLFLIAMVCGMFSIIIILIRAFYVKG